MAFVWTQDPPATYSALLSQYICDMSSTASAYVCSLSEFAATSAMVIRTVFGHSGRLSISFWIVWSCVCSVVDIACMILATLLVALHFVVPPEATKRTVCHTMWLLGVLVFLSAIFSVVSLHSLHVGMKSSCLYMANICLWNLCTKLFSEAIFSVYACATSYGRYVRSRLFVMIVLHVKHFSYCVFWCVVAGMLCSFLWCLLRFVAVLLRCDLFFVIGVAMGVVSLFMGCVVLLRCVCCCGVWNGVFVCVFMFMFVFVCLWSTSCAWDANMVCGLFYLVRR